MMIDRQRVLDLLERAKLQLTGEWLLVGGAFIALTVDERRTTEDIDLVSLSDSNEQRMQLMKLAEDAGLPVEAVNTAADFFVRKIEGWRESMTLIGTGKACVIYGPSPTLLLLLKIGRLSESDLDDCLATVVAQGREVQRERVRSAITALLPTAVEDRRGRLEQLLAALT
jgi:predicted nucleotidyltransferase